MSKFLIVGLGNIGEEYRDTRHNIGFNVLDSMVMGSGIFFNLDRLAYKAELRFKGRILILIKPTTFMNLSGKAVNYWLQTEKIPLENLLVVTDDIALPFGTLRLKGKGSDGGHNGLKSINESVSSTDYARLRFGVGNNFAKGRQSEYVLGQWSKDENQLLPQRMDVAADIIRSFVTAGLQLTMTQFNNK